MSEENGNKLVGMSGERIAALFLERHGYEILERNFHARVGELDLVAREEETGTLVFVEVKTRRSLKYGLPCEAVTAMKQAHLRKAAEVYMLARGASGCECRMDVIEILKLDGKVYLRQLKDAF